MMSKWLRWENGRQNTGYKKLLLATLPPPFPIPFDCYLLRYHQGSSIPPHIDPVDNKKHFRLNIILKKADEGGVFNCLNPIFESKRIKLFRPDVSKHSVSEITKGSRLVFSFGWVLNKKDI